MPMYRAKVLSVIVGLFWFAAVGSPFGEGWSFPPASFHQFGPFGAIGDCDDVRGVIAKGAKNVSVSKCWDDRATVPTRR